MPAAERVARASSARPSGRPMRASAPPITRLVESRTQPEAYRPPSLQPTRILEIEFGNDLLSATYASRTDRLLTDTLGLSWPHAHRLPEPGHALHLGARYLTQLLLLAMGLRQWIRNPAFEPGRIIWVRRKQDSDRLLARLAIPAGFGLADESLRRIYQFAAECCRSRLNDEGSDASPDANPISRIESFLKTFQPTHGAISRTTFQVLSAAFRLDMPFTDLGGGVFQIGWGSHAFLSDRSVTAADSAVGALLSQDKRMTAGLLGRAGLPRPVHRLAASADQAIQAAAALGFPVVIKPANRDRGEGVTTQIHDASAVTAAFDEARRLSDRVLVERQIPGVCHRIFVARGEVLYVVRRDPRSVFGDGRRTVEALIDHGNATELAKLPWLRDDPYPKDDLTVTTLSAQGLDLDSVPPEGLKVSLRPLESTLWGGDDEDMTAVIHPENAEVAVEAARVLGLANAGVDLITPDISRPWHENGGVINEVNFSPVLGVASISRGYLPEFLRRHIRGDGRIPVYALIGDERAERAALAHHLRLCNQGLNACLIRAGQTQIGQRRLSMSPHAGPVERLRACLLRREIDAVTFVVPDAAILKSGLPVDRFALLTEAAEQADGEEPGSRVPAVSGMPRPLAQNMLSAATGRLS